MKAQRHRRAAVSSSAVIISRRKCERRHGPVEVFASGGAAQGLPSVKRLHPCGFPALGGEWLSLHDCDFRRGSDNKFGAGALARMSVVGHFPAPDIPVPQGFRWGNWTGGRFRIRVPTT